MRRLIWGFAGRTYHIVGNLMHWLNYKEWFSCIEPFWNAWNQQPAKDKATPQKILDSHPNFVKNWGGWEVLIF